MVKAYIYSGESQPSSTIPEREFHYVHTSREQLDIRDHQWLGIRRGGADIAFDVYILIALIVTWS